MNDDWLTDNLSNTSPVVGSVAGVLLAAGLGRRMGAQMVGRKPLALLRGKPLIRWAAEAMAEADFAARIVVLPPEDEVAWEIVEALSGLGFQGLPLNPDPARGLLSSFQAALRVMPPAVHAAQFALADMPFVSAGTHRAVLDAFRETGAPIVVSEYGPEATKAPPHLFRADLFAEILALPDADTGPRPLLQKYAAQTVTVLRPAAELLDIDTPEALAAAQSGPEPSLPVD